ncbi:hypothetical protein HMI54_005847 [Coelomomyces lativittatus]|nr:hypothetical protein HMI54_005847 [Coelomomyces lativittatus]
MSFPSSPPLLNTSNATSVFTGMGPGPLPLDPFRDHAPPPSMFLDKDDLDDPLYGSLRYRSGCIPPSNSMETLPSHEKIHRLSITSRVGASISKINSDSLSGLQRIMHLMGGNGSGGHGVGGVAHGGGPVTSSLNTSGSIPPHPVPTRSTTPLASLGSVHHLASSSSSSSSPSPSTSSSNLSPSLSSTSSSGYRPPRSLRRCGRGCWTSLQPRWVRERGQRIWTLLVTYVRARFEAPIFKNLQTRRGGRMHSLSLDRLGGGGKSLGLGLGLGLGGVSKKIQETWKRRRQGWVRWVNRSPHLLSQLDRMCVCVTLYQLLFNAFAVAWSCHVTLSPGWIWVGYGMDMVLLMECMVNLNRHYENDFGFMVQDPYDIQVHYFHTLYGKWDILGSLPFDGIVWMMPRVPFLCLTYPYPHPSEPGFLYTPSHVPWSLYVWAGLRMTRYLRLPRLIQRFANWNIPHLHVAYIRLIKNFILFFFVAHLNACLFFLLNQFEPVGTAWIDQVALRNDQAEIPIISQYFFSLYVVLSFCLVFFFFFKSVPALLFCWNHFSPFIQQFTFRFPSEIIRQKEGENDGLVSVKSAKWGIYLETLPTDHWGVNNRWFSSRINPQFDAIDFYVQMSTRLWKAGF